MCIFFNVQLEFNFFFNIENVASTHPNVQSPHIQTYAYRSVPSSTQPDMQHLHNETCSIYKSRCVASIKLEVYHLSTHPNVQHTHMRSIQTSIYRNLQAAICLLNQICSIYITNRVTSILPDVQNLHILSGCFQLASKTLITPK